MYGNDAGSGFGCSRIRVTEAVGDTGRGRAPKQFGRFSDEAVTTANGGARTKGCSCDGE